MSPFFVRDAAGTQMDVTDIFVVSSTLFHIPDMLPGVFQYNVRWRKQFLDNRFSPTNVLCIRDAAGGRYTKVAENTGSNYLFFSIIYTKIL